MGIETPHFDPIENKKPTAHKRAESLESNVSQKKTHDNYEPARQSIKETLHPSIHSGDEREMVKKLFGVAQKCAKVFLFISTLSGIPGMLEGSTSASDIAEILQRSKDSQNELLVESNKSKGSMRYNDTPPATIEKTV